MNNLQNLRFLIQNDKKSIPIFNFLNRNSVNNSSID